MKEKKPYQERFLERIVNVCEDGRKEIWELEETSVGESKMYVTYRLKRIEKYETV